MGSRDKAVQLLKDGYPPGKIAKTMGISIKSVTAYLFQRVGEGVIRRSDIAFSVPRETRAIIENCIRQSRTQKQNRLWRVIEKSGNPIDRNDLYAYLQVRDARVVLGDMYELVRSIELALHKLIRDCLVQEFGQNEWWRSGIPENIRAECAASRERDTEPADDPYRYTTVIHLKDILDKSWACLSKRLPERVCADKRDFLSRIGKLNRIRNAVMHPVRGTNPTEEDFEFLRKLHSDLGVQ